MPGFGGVEQFDPTTSGGLHNILTGGDYAPWNLLNSEGIGHNNFEATPYQTNPGAFQGGWNGSHSPYNPNALAGQAGQAGNAQAPGFAESMGGLSGLAGMLQGQANGTAPSLAMEQLRQAQQTNAANTMALQASQRGLNPSQAALNSAQVNAQGNQNVAAQGVGAALQERTAAQGMLGQTYGQMGGMGLQQQGQNNSMVQYYMSLGMSAQQAQLQANIAEQQLNSQNYNAAQGLNAGVAAGNAQNQSQNAGAMFGAAGALGGALFGAAAQGGVVPGYSGGGMVGACPPGYAGGGAVAPAPMMGPGTAQPPLSPMPLGLVSALSANGGVLPGVDQGVDTMTDGRIALRPGEVVVNQENPIYPAAKAAVEGAQARPAAPSQPEAGGESPLAAAIARAFGLGGGSGGRQKRNTGGEQAVGMGTGG